MHVARHRTLRHLRIQRTSLWVLESKIYHLAEEVKRRSPGEVMFKQTDCPREDRKLGTGGYFTSPFCHLHLTPHWPLQLSACACKSILFVWATFTKCVCVCVCLCVRSREWSAVSLVEQSDWWTSLWGCHSNTQALIRSHDCRVSKRRGEFVILATCFHINHTLLNVNVTVCIYF